MGPGGRSVCQACPQPSTKRWKPARSPQCWCRARINRSACEAVGGVAAGVFRPEVDATDLHMLISAFCFFRVSNRYTFGTIFKRDLSELTDRLGHAQDCL